ncbi:hypothetical protein [Halobaculum sp. D14]|uniref:hypothetical protein n=1 Tax=Halobaculum sp. D14 TaxID=3421642 RepID=UPI003EBA053B
MTRRSRGQVNISDALLSVLVLIALVALIPPLNTFLNMIASSADPLTATVLQLFIPFLFIALLITIGVSARGGGA